MRAGARRARASARPLRSSWCPDDSESVAVAGGVTSPDHRDGDPLAVVERVEAHAGERERRLDLLHQPLHGFRIERQTGRRSHECLCFAPGASRFERPPRRGVDQRTRRDGDSDEHDEGNQVLRLIDGQRRVRLDEEPVDEQRRQDGRHGAHDDAAERRRSRAPRRVRAGVRSRVPTCRGTGRVTAISSGIANDREQPREGRSPPDRLTARVIRRRRVAHRRVRAMTCTSISGHEPCQPGHERPVDELVQAASPARAQHDLGGLLLAGEGRHPLSGVVRNDVVHGATEFQRPACVAQPARRRSGSRARR